MFRTRPAMAGVHDGHARSICASCSCKSGPTLQIATDYHPPRTALTESAAIRSTVNIHPAALSISRVRTLQVPADPPKISLQRTMVP